MGTDNIALDGIDENASDLLDDLSSILHDYENLTESQEEERQELLTRIDEITRKTRKLDNIDAKLDKFSSLLLDIRSQVAGNPHAPETQKSLSQPSLSKKSDILASDEDINQLSQEAQKKSDNLDEEIASLTHLLEKKNNKIDLKDQEIDELNDRLDMLSGEKARLAEELERINSAIHSWKSQLDLLQQLASSDPRYRVIETLKKHGDLSDIQLAFTMGTSITQLRKYLEDLLGLKLVQKSSSGRYSWSGKDIKDAL